MSSHPGTLFIDVDRTLFNVDAVYEAAYRQNRSPQEVALERAPEFLYPDTLEFLRDHAAYQLVLVTFGDPQFQSEKVRRSGIGDCVDDALYTDTEMKGPVLARATAGGAYAAPYVFLDDDIEQLQSVRAHAPDVQPIKISRTPAPGTEWDGPDVTNLEEFATLLIERDVR